MRMLVGDIGGTNARLIMYESSAEHFSSSDEMYGISKHKLVSKMYYKNNDFDSFTDILWQFMNMDENRNVKVDSCCIAVAGPVSNNQINFTNREGWIVDGNTIQQEMNIGKVQLINDFVANGYGVLTLSEKELVTIQKGNPTPIDRAPVALLGAGTGLGECFITPDNHGDFNVFPTEGGHVDFAPRTPFEVELLSFLHRKLTETKAGATDDVPRISVERLVSGKGLENIYEFLREKYPDQVDAVQDENYMKSTERGRLIGQEKYNYQLYMKSLEIMFGIYGGEAGNVALKYLPSGGVYVAGGIAPKNLELITAQDSDFLHRFLDKGRMSSIMKDFPVHIVLKEDLGLRGAHAVASRLCQQMLRTDQADATRPVRLLPKRELPPQPVLETRLSTSHMVLASMTAAFTAGVVVAIHSYFRTITK